VLPEAGGRIVREYGYALDSLDAVEDLLVEALASLEKDYQKAQ